MPSCHTLLCPWPALGLISTLLCPWPAHLAASPRRFLRPARRLICPPPYTVLCHSPCSAVLPAVPIALRLLPRCPLLAMHCVPPCPCYASTVTSTCLSRRPALYSVLSTFSLLISATSHPCSPVLQHAPILPSVPYSSFFPLPLFTYPCPRSCLALHYGLLLCSLCHALPTIQPAKSNLTNFRPLGGWGWKRD